MKYTCQPTGNSLDELGIPKNPYFDPSYVSVASFCLISAPYRTFHFSILTDTGLMPITNITITIVYCQLPISKLRLHIKHISYELDSKSSTFKILLIINERLL